MDVSQYSKLGLMLRLRDSLLAYVGLGLYTGKQECQNTVLKITYHAVGLIYFPNFSYCKNTILTRKQEEINILLTKSTYARPCRRQRFRQTSYLFSVWSLATMNIHRNSCVEIVVAANGRTPSRASYATFDE